MISKALLVLVLAFVTLGALRWTIARPRPRWLMPAVAGIVVTVLLWRFGTIGVFAGALVVGGGLLLSRPAARSAALDIDEAAARALLGVSATAGKAEIRAAHRRLIAAAHPDRGGAQEMSARLNVARDLLLKRANAAGEG